MSGGGGSSGGAVVGGPSPIAAALAGQYQVQAAQAASDAAQKAINEAIVAMSRNYQQARYDVQPYRTEGVQALNQLNQYLQLDPYNPGAAPTAPKMPTIDDYLGKIKSSEVRQFIEANSIYQPYKGADGNMRAQPYYVGDVDPATLPRNKPGQSAWYNTGILGLPSGVTTNAGAFVGLGKGSFPGTAGSGFYTNPAIQEAARRQLAGERVQDQMPIYESEVEAYNRNLEEWTQNKAWYDEYTAEGPYTQEQVSEKISNLPGYQAELQQGTDAIQKAASAKGYLGSGRVLKELMNFGQNTLSRFYGAELDRLAQLAGAGQQAATTSAGTSAGLGGNLASLYSSLGDTKANAALASGNALAQAILAGNQQYKVIGGSDSGGGLGGIGSVLGGIGSIASAFSSKALKDTMFTPSTEEILKNVREMSLDQWKYKGIDTQHVGPYAEEFRDRFNVGDGQTIAFVDMCGVLFASVKELSKQVDELKAELKRKS